jgi:hypothetical protein
MTDKRTALLKKYTPMTKGQLKAVVADYAATFPDWALVQDGMAFVRSFGPIQQMIWFQKMSSASYRPSHVINTTALSMPRMLTQLPFRPSTISQTSHSHRWPEMLAAMEQQFKPDIRKPLDVAEVLELCEAEARLDSTNDLTMLAVLYAWLGRDAEALDCCERMQHCPLPTLAPMPEWEDAMRTFGRALAKAVGAGTAREFLESAAEETKAR